MGEKHRPARELTLSEITAIADRVAEAPGAYGITVTGGEPLLRSDIADVVSVCKRSGLKVALATNGTLLTEQLAHSLVLKGIEHFDIGFTEPNPLIRQALTSAVKTGCTVSASICVHNGSYRNIGVLTKTAAALGADSVVLNRFVPTGRGKQNRKSLLLKDEGLVHALKLANSAAAVTGIFVYTGLPVEPCIISRDRFPEIHFSTCQCGEVKWAIDPAGNLRTCEQNPEALGNLLQSSFAKIVNNKSGTIDKFRKWRKTETCFNCSLPESCRGGCRFA